ncbi:MAG: ABC transporter substrate-binding protein [Mariprofundales bacterium]|nr:ABC transporter substrate-binding protein [Mariprofundales bacterium]
MGSCRVVVMVRCLVGLLLVLVISSCTKHEVVRKLPPVVHDTAVVAERVAPRLMELHQDSAIDLVMREVRQGDIELEEAQRQLREIVATAPTVLADEARFRAVELRLEFDDPYAEQAAHRLLSDYADHSLIPYLHYWLATWLQRHDDVTEALHHMAAVVDSVAVAADLRHRVLQAGLRVMAVERDDRLVVAWLLRRMPYLQGEDLLTVARMAASRSSPLLMADLRQRGVINTPTFAPYYQEVARIALMSGDREFLATIAEWSRMDIGGTAESRMVRRWSSGRSRAVRIGVLLPLSGRYARFGRQALHGVRMAVERLPYGKDITLLVADSAGDGEMAVAGYTRLVAEGCVAVIGPVIAHDVQEVAPYLHADVPVIALTNQRALAKLAEPLFVHSVGSQVQAAFLAEWLRGRLHGGDDRSRGEQPEQVAVMPMILKLHVLF